MPGAAFVSAARLVRAPCGVLSASLPGLGPEENLARHGELLDILLTNGFHPVEAVGEWDGVPELCWVVPGIGEDELFGLARDFGQEAVAVFDGASSSVLPV